MVQRLAGVRICDGTAAVPCGWHEIRGIGFYQNTARGQRPEQLALRGFAAVKEIRRERKVCAAVHEEIREDRRAGIGVEQKPARRAAVLLQHLTQRFVGLEAMHGDGGVSLARDFPLTNEDALLVGDVMAGDPAIEAGLTDAGRRMAVEKPGERLFPLRRTLRDVPRMQAESRPQKRMRLTKRSHGIPVGFTRAVHDCRPGTFFQDRITEGIEPGIVEVIVGVAVSHWSCWRKTAGLSRASKLHFAPGKDNRIIRSPMSNTESIPAETARPRSRRRSSGGGWSKGWTILTAVAVIAAGLFFGVRIWIMNYLQSDKFRVWISGEISRKLNTEVRFDGIQWQDSSASAGTFTATGSTESPFSRIEARDLRATINTGAIWDRVWQVDEVKIARVFLDLSPGGPRSSVPQPNMDSASRVGSSGGFFSSLMPNRTVVQGIGVEQFSLLWKSAERSIEARSMALHVKPAETNAFFLASGNGGTLALSMLPDESVKLRHFEASFQDDEFTLDEFTAEAAGADISVEGTVQAGNRPALDLTGTVAGLDLARVLPEDWLKRLHGKAGGEVRVTGDPREFDRLLWRGKANLRDGLLEGLPLLHVIARKTRNESFIRLNLKEARTNFTRAAEGGWLLEELTVDAPGLLRLKGTAAAAPDGALQGELLLGIVPGTLRYLAGAEQSVFLALDQLLVTQRERVLITADDAGLRWTRLRLRGTLDNPQEDLADRLAKAWFNATVDEVMNMSMEGAVKAAESASKLAAEAAGTVLDNAPAILENGLKSGADLLDGGAGLLEKGIGGGLKTIEGLIPGGK